MRLLRVAVMGGGGVGKSAVTVRFINGEYVEMYDPTIEDSYRKMFEVDGHACLIEILDTAGIDQYLSLNDMFIRDSDGFVLVFSITQRDSLQEVLRTRESIARVKPEGTHIPMVLVGKYDRQVKSEEGKSFADQWKCEYIETSARDNANILPVFESVVRQLRTHHVSGRRLANASAVSRRRKRKCVCM